MLIAHTTDLLGDDDAAFIHALALAARSGATLATVHAAEGESYAPRLPRARDLLDRWQVEASVEQQYVAAEAGDDRTETLVEVLQRLEPDLLVCATHARGPLRWLLSGSTAEVLARNLPCFSLLIPIGGSDLVDTATGALRLNRILVPAGNQLELERGIAAACRFASWASAASPELVVLHVSDEHPMPLMTPPPGFTIQYREASGNVEARILDSVRELAPSCLAMSTHGHDSLLDVLFGSHTERLLHGAHVPVLWVPIGSTATAAP